MTVWCTCPAYCRKHEYNRHLCSHEPRKDERQDRENAAAKRR